MQDLEVLEVGVFSIDIELDSCHGHVHYFGVESKLVSDMSIIASGSNPHEEHSLYIESKTWHSAALYQSNPQSTSSGQPFSLNNCESIKPQYISRGLCRPSNDVPRLYVNINTQPSS